MLTIAGMYTKLVRIDQIMLPVFRRIRERARCSFSARRELISGACSVLLVTRYVPRNLFFSGIDQCSFGLVLSDAMAWPGAVLN